MRRSLNDEVSTTTDCCAGSRARFIKAFVFFPQYGLQSISVNMAVLYFGQVLRYFDPLWRVRISRIPTCATCPANSLLLTLRAFKEVNAGNLTLAASVVCRLCSLLVKILFLAEQG